ncbi:hypothetical protein [Halalkalibacter akibai]|uniref:Uncharacterized protein n=1 Tax=Halalkalibacter akibai (strain ATCC 43226 / DSM 21942 / CIP 109018 / JCM 9157 / 1139) TaxID=1236973 RepID=W4QXQ6_HALA3|nr:hypothetical protein [Halalkalibacter akibai]GAE36697.1 hypothetical protein JCM9157_3908 [Halalkalibacter akibai JCM 9157]
MIKINGLNEFQRKIKQLEDNAKALQGENSISFNELFSGTFMKKHTNFLSIDDMFKNSSFKIDSIEDFEAIDKASLDEFVNSTTNFITWSDMQEKAVTEWTAKKLGF